MTAKRTGPYTPPTAPTNIPEEPKAGAVAVPAKAAPAKAVPVKTDPIRIPQDDTAHAEPSTDTGIMASDIIVAGTQQMRQAAENRRKLIAERMDGLRADWQEHQARLVELRQLGEALVAEMNSLAAQMDPIVTEHERLVAAIHHFDATLETLGQSR